ncbi:MAG: hypothetical protein QMC90_03575 [Dehalococcoidales bacterium]|nr:hypothetical protein [Dehalococcoidales bacterium]
MDLKSDTDWSWKPTTMTRMRKHMRSKKGYEDLPWMPMKARRKWGRGSKQRTGGKAVEEVVGKIIREDHYKCGFCRGTGEEPAGFTCPACKGKGEIPLNPPAVICAYCRGTGKQKPRSDLTCLACKGKGVVAVIEPIELCSKCEGRGYTPGDKTLPCLKCKGKGVVAVKDGEKGKYLRRPGGSERDVAEAIYQLGGVASVAEIAPRVRMSTAYTESFASPCSTRVI